MVGPHATCQVGIGCKGESRAHGEGYTTNGGGLRVSTFHLEHFKWGCRV